MYSAKLCSEENENVPKKVSTQQRQKGYYEEEPTRTKNITPTILEFHKNKMFVLVNKNDHTWVFMLFLLLVLFELL
jgi:hypothetical protein